MELESGRRDLLPMRAAVSRELDQAIVVPAHMIFASTSGRREGLMAGGRGLSGSVLRLVDVLPLRSGRG